MMPTAIVVFWCLKSLLIGCLLYKLRLSRHSQRSSKTRQVATSFHPKVCVQLPLYNEPEHARDLLRCIALLSWPENRLEIQILDDSTDHTCEIVDKTVAKLLQENPERRFSIVRRSQRQGYKAGALANGMERSDAEYFAIFDCDFRPEPDFMERLIGEFRDERVGAVQAFWRYKNSDRNLLTRLQTILLNHHFMHEQAGRFHLDYLFNFNGTAGIWRRQAIVDAGGWSGITVTEDLYLSYVAQMQGWRLKLRSDVSCPSYLPENIAAFIIQQRRWAKGNGQVLRVLGGNLLKYGVLRKWAQSIDALIHLSSYGLSSVILIAFFLLPFWVDARVKWMAKSHFLDPARIIDLSLWGLLFGLFIWLFSRPRISWKVGRTLEHRLLDSVLLFLSAPLFACLTVGSFWHGLLAGEKQQEFFRTPKSAKSDCRPPMWDQAVCVGIFLFSLGVSASLFAQKFYISSLFFVGHACATLWIWRDWSTRKNVLMTLAIHPKS